LQILVGSLLSIIGEDDELVDRDVELFQTIELLLIIRVANKDVPSGLIQLSKMVDFRNQIL
jgi:hypothetical protein